VATLGRVKAVSNQHTEWKDKQPFKAVLENDIAALTQAGERGLASCETERLSI
jgi:hypothetical protein